MKKCGFLSFIRKYFFIAFAVISLVIPDFIIRYIIRESQFEETLYAYTVPCAFTALWIFLILYFCVAILPKKAGRITFLIFSVAINILVFCEYIYFKIFSQLFWLSSILLVGEAGDYVGFAMEYTKPLLWICTGAGILTSVVAFLFWNKPKKSRVRSILCVSVPIVAILGMNIALQPWGVSEMNWDSWQQPRTVYQKYTDVNRCTAMSGLYQFIYKNFETGIFGGNNFSKEEYESATEYFENRGLPEDNSMTGVFKDKNVIVIMMESIDDWMIDPKIMPNLYEMQRKGISFDSHFAPTFGTGYTFNSEFSVLSGFATPKSATTAVNFSKNNFEYSLANQFKKAGYTAKSFHMNLADFYNRGIMHKALGMDEYVCFQDYAPYVQSIQDSEITEIEEVYKKMTEGEKFFDFVITYSAHVPYTWDDEKLKPIKEKYPEMIDENEKLEMNNLKILARDTDEFIGRLVQKLGQDGLLEDTVIVCYSDHWAYGYSEPKEIEAMLRQGEIDFLHRVPFVIFAEGIEPQVITKVTKTLDIYPTVSNMFGLEKHPYYAGEDAFDPEYDGYFYFEDGSWFDGEIYHSIDAGFANEYEKERTEEISEIIRMNDIVVFGDYFNNL